MGIALEHDKKIDALTWRVSELEEKVKILAIAVITNGGIDIPEPEPVEEDVEYEDEELEELLEEEYFLYFFFLLLFFLSLCLLCWDFDPDLAEEA